MPTDLTGQQISDIYPSFLHTGTSSLCSLETPVYDGIGNISTLSISTTSISLSNAKINEIEYPQSVGNAGEVIVSDGVSKFNVTSIAAAIAAANGTIPANGTYSSPVISINNGVVSSVISTLDNKTFFYPSRQTTEAGPNLTQLQTVISWNTPLTGDKVNILQKVKNANGSLNDLSINVLTYTSTGWGNLQTY